MKVLFVEFLVAEVDWVGSGKDLLHRWHPTVGRPRNEPQHDRDDRATQRVGQDQILHAVIRLEVAWRDAGDDDRRRAHVSVDVVLRGLVSSQGVVGARRLLAGPHGAVTAPAGPSGVLGHGGDGLCPARDAIAF